MVVVNECTTLSREITRGQSSYDFKVQFPRGGTKDFFETYSTTATKKRGNK